MARSRQRLALNNDPGKTTQMIQERILLDLDSRSKRAAEIIEQTEAYLLVHRTRAPRG